MVCRYDVYPQVDCLLVLFRLVVQPQDKCQYLQVVLAAFLYELRGKGVNPDDSDVGMQFLYDMLYVLFTFDVGLQVLTSGAIFLKHLA